MIGLDTNVLLRYLVQDDTRQAVVATRFVERSLTGGLRGHVSLVTLAELVWVLRGRYGVAREDIVDALVHVMSDARFAIQDETAAWAALDAYGAGSVDFDDALIAAVDRLHGCTKTVTFDRKAARIDGVELLV